MEKKRPRIKINDLPKDMKITKDELKRIKGGAYDIPIIKEATSFGRIRFPSTFVGMKY